MNARLATLTLAFLLFLAGLAWILMPGEPGGVAVESSPAAEPPPGAGADADAAAPGLRAQQSGRSVAGASAPTAPDPAPDGTAPDKAGARVIVLAPDGAPAAGAEVFLAEMEAADIYELQRRRALGTDDPERDLIELGTRYAADAEGVAQVPRLLPRTRVLARTDEAIGRASVGESPADELVVRLEPRASIRILVVDARGQPVPAAPVALQRRSDEHWRDALVLTADDSGAVVCDRLWAHLDLADLEASPPARFAVGVLGAESELPDEACAPIDAALLDAGTCTLVCAATGELRVRIVDTRGETLPTRGHVFVSQRSHNLREFALGARRTSRPATSGEVRFEHLALGLELAVDLALDGGLAAVDRTVVDGPTRPGEVVEAVVVRDAANLLRGRLTGPGGRALARARLDVEVATHHGRMPVSWRTDEDGVFAYSVDPLDGEGPRRDLALHWTDPDGRPWSAVVPIAAQLPPGTTDLGTLALEPTPVLLSGRVLDHRGAGVAQAHVSVRWEVERNGERESESIYWLQRLAVTTDEDGAFAIHAHPPEAARGTLVVTAAGHDRQSFPVTLGDTAVTLRLAAPTTLAGRVLVDPVHADASQFLMVLEPVESGPRALPQRVPWQDPADGVLPFRAAVAGGQTWDAVLRTRAGVELARVEAIAIEAGQELAPPALNPLDLRGRLRTITITTEDPAGLPIDVRAHFPGNWRGGSAVGRAGQLELLIAEPIPSLWLSAAGCQSVHLESVDADRRVVLQPALDTVFTVPPEWLEDGSLHLRMGASFRGDTQAHGQALRVERVRFGRDGRATLPLPAAGPWAPWLQAQLGGPNTRAVSVPLEQLVTVRAGGETHALAVDRAGLDAALAELRDGD